MNIPERRYIYIIIQYSIGNMNNNKIFQIKGDRNKKESLQIKQHKDITHTYIHIYN